jgi:hypothetical protein
MNGERKMKVTHQLTTLGMMTLLIAGAVLLYTLADESEMAGALVLAAIAVSARPMKVVNTGTDEAKP